MVKSTTMNKDSNDANQKEPKNHFIVDSGLKNIIGQELITNDFVAIYELVKNCLDAHASKVDLVIDNDLIIIADNGKGMLVNKTIDEIKSKWLRVAYSAKKQGVEDESLNDDFRKKITDRKRAFGGSKGVGRFSCDRLGKNLTLYTKTSSQNSYNKLYINWGDFEDNDLQKFENISVDRSVVSSLPEDINKRLISKNTLIVISNLRSEWSYDKLQSLKKELAQLINPFEENQDIQIEIHAKEYTKEDLESKSEFSKVNGLVINNIYEAIGLSTTRIEVRFHSGIINTKLIDRGSLIYEIQEKSDFEHINDIPINIDLSFLNRAAKTRFTRFMGITALEFGHIFLFKNGYRVMPYGVRGNDILGYDDRKSQGMMRYLGSRDLLGHISILNDTNNLSEPSSRDGGLIRNPAYTELEELVKNHALKRLEAYVVGITFKDSSDKDKEDISGLYKEGAKIRIIELINKLTKGKEIKIIDYHKKIVDIIDEKSNDFNNTIANLKQIATASKNTYLLGQIKSAETNFIALQKAKNESHRAQLEAKEVAAKETVKATAALEAQKKVEVQLKTEIKRSLFLKSLTEVDVEDIIGLNHQVIFDASNIKNTVNDAIERIALDGEYFNQSVALEILQGISLSNQKILLASMFATRANFSHQSDGITEDMIAFLKDYILVSANPNAMYIDVTIEVEEEVKFMRTFKPLELSILVDNFISNAQKAKAPCINFKISVKEDTLNIIVNDNGDGLGPDIDISRIFDLAYSGTQGSGIGLFHIKSVLSQLNGTVKLLKTPNNEAKFLVEINNEN
jgi:signal transduction histidine kinase